MSITLSLSRVQKEQPVSRVNRLRAGWGRGSYIIRDVWARAVLGKLVGGPTLQASQPLGSCARIQIRQPQPTFCSEESIENKLTSMECAPMCQCNGDSLQRDVRWRGSHVDTHSGYERMDCGGCRQEQKCDCTKSVFLACSAGFVIERSRENYSETQ